MTLKGNTVEEQIWNFLKDKGLNNYGIAGLMGNLYAESGLKATNLQNSYETKLGMTDDSYTTSVDNGDYTNFVRDSAGYGLAQWTYWSRKQNLLEFARSREKSIGDLEIQLEFLWMELQGYKTVLEMLKTATEVRQASDCVLTQYEKPADQSAAVQIKRANYGQSYYDKYAGKSANTQNGGTDMSNSSLVTYKNVTANKTSPRTHAIDTITIHCIVGQWTAKQGCDYFANTDRECSANYVVGKDGSIGLSVDEKDRSWCSSNAANDHRAVTIEVASDTTSPYAVTDKAYEALIKLVADICKRNGIKKLVWSANKADRVNHKNGCNMTVHRDFANKSCPGEYLYNRHGEIAKRVNALLGATTSSSSTTSSSTQTSNTSFPKVPFTVKVLVSDLNIRSTPAMGNNVVGQTGKGVFTIVEVQDGWGKLKSGAGWIYLENTSYVTILSTSTASSTQAATTSPTKSVEEIAKEVLNGKWGNGAERKKKLEAAGYNYSQVQAIVNKMCK